MRNSALIGCISHKAVEKCAKQRTIKAYAKLYSYRKVYFVFFGICLELTWRPLCHLQRCDTQRPHVTLKTCNVFQEHIQLLMYSTQYTDISLCQ